MADSYTDYIASNPALFLDGGDEPREKRGFDLPGDVDPGMAIPHVFGFDALIRGSAQTYFREHYDEAMRNSRENAVAMQRDEHLQACLREKRRGVAKLKWHLESDNSKKDPREKMVCDGLTRAVKRTRYWKRLVRHLSKADWFGRYGVQCVWDWAAIRMPQIKSGPSYLGNTVETDDVCRTLILKRFTPVNGDKIGYTWDHCPMVRINGGYANQFPEADIVTDNLGHSLVLRGTWRDRFIIHTSDPDDSDFEDALASDSIHGHGIRSWLYWSWWTKNEYMTNIVDALERYGLGFIVIYYLAGDPASKAEAENVAKKHSRRSVILIPQSTQARAAEGIQVVETPTAGMLILRELQKACEDREERFIIGQKMSSDHTGSGGLGGSGAADMANDTKSDVIAEAAEELAETLTGDDSEIGLISYLKKHNYPWADFDVRLVYDIPDPDAQGKLEAVKTTFDLGIDFIKDEVRSLTGMGTPQPADETVSKTQMAQTDMALETQAHATWAAAGMDPADDPAVANDKDQPPDGDKPAEPTPFTADLTPTIYDRDLFDFMDEPRIPAGNPGAGEWTAGGQKADKRAADRDKILKGWHAKVGDEIPPSQGIARHAEPAKRHAVAKPFAKRLAGIMEQMKSLPDAGASLKKHVDAILGQIEQLRTGANEHGEAMIEKDYRALHAAARASLDSLDKNTPQKHGENTGVPRGTPEKPPPAGFLFQAAMDHLATLYAYNPAQPRVPAGVPEGGQWTATDHATVTHVDHENKILHVRPHAMANVRHTMKAADAYEQANEGWNVVVGDHAAGATQPQQAAQQPQAAAEHPVHKAILDKVAELAAGQYKPSRASENALVPIFEIRQHIAQAMGDQHASHEVLDQHILDLWRQGKIELEGLSDGERFTSDQKDNGLRDANGGRGEFWIEAGQRNKNLPQQNYAFDPDEPRDESGRWTAIPENAKGIIKKHHGNMTKMLGWLHRAGQMGDEGMGDDKETRRAYHPDDVLQDAPAYRDRALAALKRAYHGHLDALSKDHGEHEAFGAFKDAHSEAHDAIAAAFHEMTAHVMTWARMIKPQMKQKGQRTGISNSEMSHLGDLANQATNHAMKGHDKAMPHVAKLSKPQDSPKTTLFQAEPLPPPVPKTKVKAVVRDDAGRIVAIRESEE